MALKSEDIYMLNKLQISLLGYTYATNILAWETPL